MSSAVFSSLYSLYNSVYRVKKALTMKMLLHTLNITSNSGGTLLKENVLD